MQINKEETIKNYYVNEYHAMTNRNSIEIR